jgi:hypothetical protein
VLRLLLACCLTQTAPSPAAEPTLPAELIPFVSSAGALISNGEGSAAFALPALPGFALDANAGPAPPLPAALAGGNELLVWTTPAWTGALATITLGESEAAAVLAVAAANGLDATGVASPLASETPRLIRLELRGFGTPAPLARAVGNLRRALLTAGLVDAPPAVGVRVTRLPRPNLDHGELPAGLFAHQVRVSGDSDHAFATTTLVLRGWELATAVAGLTSAGWQVAGTSALPLLGDAGTLVRLDAQASGREPELVEAIRRLAASLEHHPAAGVDHGNMHEHHHPADPGGG